MESYRVNFQPMGQNIACPAGTSLLEAARQLGIAISSTCGGRGTCGRCRIRILSGKTSPVTTVEEKYLGGGELAAGYRLACQVLVEGEAAIYVPQESITGVQRLQVAGEEREVPLAPPIRECALRLSEPSIEDLRPDAERLLEGLEAQCGLNGLEIDLACLLGLSPTLRDVRWQPRVTLRGREAIRVCGDGRPALGMAIDLGTTKLAFYLVDLRTGRTLATQGAMNPQLVYGEDVMARIAYAMEGPANARGLSRVVIELLTSTVRVMCQAEGAAPEDVLEVVVVGNTAMHHLLVGLPTAQLGTAPYVPAVSRSLNVKARELGLSIAPGGYIHLLPNIAGFVGADHVAMILASGLHETRETVLGMDIGTNTEIVIAREGELLSCSCASGPAFEGAHIRHGMRAASGAIESVRVAGGEVRVETVDGNSAVGICGSGILDAVAELYRVGAINSRGRLQEGHPLVRRGEDMLEVVLVEAQMSGTGRDIVLCQEDINQIQLAKGAIRTGIEALLRHTDTQPQELSQVVIAGGFGMYIRPQSAMRIGMFPAVPLERFRQVGNAAGIGAKLALISQEEREAAWEIARRVRYIELMAEPSFMEDFASAMHFPPQEE